MMDVAEQIRWIPAFGLERELDWLRNMHDWMISKKRYWGLALPIWECDACGHYEVIRDESRADRRGPSQAGRPLRATRRIARTSTPSRSPARSAAAEMTASRMWAIPGWTPASCPSPPELSHRSRLLGAVVPGALDQRVVPGPVPQLVLQPAGYVHRAGGTAALPGELFATPCCWLRTARPCTSPRAT